MTEMLLKMWLKDHNPNNTTPIITNKKKILTTWQSKERIIEKDIFSVEVDIPE